MIFFPRPADVNGLSPAEPNQLVLLVLAENMPSATATRHDRFTLMTAIRVACWCSPLRARWQIRACRHRYPRTADREPRRTGEYLGLQSWISAAGGLGFAFPSIRIVIADAGHESRKLAQELRKHDGYERQIVERKHQAFSTSDGCSWAVCRRLEYRRRKIGVAEPSTSWIARIRRLFHIQWNVYTERTIKYTAPTSPRQPGNPDRGR